jgi:hypothetical protein
MSDPISELISSLRGHDNWRLRSVSEERALKVRTDLSEHIKALQRVEARLSTGDVEGAARGLKEIQAKIGDTAADLMPVSEEFKGPAKQVAQLSKLAAQYGLFEADNWLNQVQELDESTPLGTLSMVKKADMEKRSKSRDASRKRRGIGQFAPKK